MSPSIVLLMPDTPQRKNIWTPSGEATARKLGMEVRIAETLGPEAVQGVDAIMTSWGSPRIEQPYLDAAPNLKIVGHAAGSVKPIISPELYAKKIPVVCANAVMARCVAQWALMMTMISARRMITYCDFGEHRNLQWPAQRTPIGLHRLKVGIWGYGNIARDLIQQLKSLGVENIMVTSGYMTDEQAEKNGLIRGSLDELFEYSDIIHTLTSLTPKQIGRVGANLLAKLRDGATLINAGRAHLIDETAMMNELRSGRIFACLDVYHKEPLDMAHELRTLPNVILTPHNAGTGSRDLFASLILEEFDRCFKGNPLQHEITEQRAAVMTTEFKQMKK